MQSDLHGKVVLVTGAAGGIGSAIARRFAEEGAQVVLNYRKNQSGADALAREIGGERCLAIRADLSKEPEVKKLFAQAIKRFGRVDTLIANAGSWETKDVPLHEMSLKQWQNTQDNVLTATFLSVREFFRIVTKQKTGNAVLIASTAGVFGEANHADYAAAKGAMAYGLVRTLKNEIARIAPHTKEYCGGRINCICPGWTVVPRTAPKLNDHANVRKVTSTMALPQIARPDDIAHVTVFLSSDRLARHVTGQTWVIAGGMEGRLLWQTQEIDPAIV
ncbi:MAG: SDR family NAD(P)-dependent oxidoreductase [Limisphaerales bacterium]